MQFSSPYIGTVGRPYSALYKLDPLLSRPLLIVRIIIAAVSPISQFLQVRTGKAVKMIYYKNRLFILDSDYQFLSDWQFRLRSLTVSSYQLIGL